MIVTDDQRALPLGLPLHPTAAARRACDIDGRDSWLWAMEAWDHDAERAADWDWFVATGER